MALIIGTLGMLTVPVMIEAETLNRYSDYGMIEQSNSSNNDFISISNDPFGYSDQYTDSESGLQYLQIRYYNPMIMRFTEMDTYPLLNRYAYANENPVMNDDPSGHRAVGEQSQSGSKESSTKVGFMIVLGAIAASTSAIFSFSLLSLPEITTAISVGALTGFTTSAASATSISLTSVEHFDTHLSSNSLHKLALASEIIGFSQIVLAPLSTVPINYEASLATIEVEGLSAEGIEDYGRDIMDYRQAQEEVRVNEQNMHCFDLLMARGRVEMKRELLEVDARLYCKAIDIPSRTIALRFYSILPTMLTVGAGIWFGIDALKYRSYTDDNRNTAVPAEESSVYPITPNTAYTR